MNFERRVEFSPAYDKRDPDPKKNYGIGSVNIRFVLIGDKRAVQFYLMTGSWVLPHVAEEYKAKGLVSEVLPADLGYHSPVPMYDGHDSITENCEYIGGPCYYDGSGLAANRIWKVLLEEGDKGVWRELEEYYLDLFGEEKEQVK